MPKKIEKFETKKVALLDAEGVLDELPLAEMRDVYVDVGKVDGKVKVESLPSRQAVFMGSPPARSYPTNTR